MNILIAIIALVALIYGFNAVKRSSSPRVKRIGLGVWFGLGLAVLGYLGLYGDWDDPGIIILGTMVALFWVLPTGALLYIDTKK